MKGLLFDREDQTSFKKIKHDIEEMLGFHGLQSPLRNDLRKSNYASSRGGSPSPKAHSSTNKKTAVKKKVNRRDSLQQRSPIIKLSPPKTARSNSAMPDQGPRHRNLTPSFSEIQPPTIPGKKQTVWQKLYSEPPTKQSMNNPYYRLDMKFEKLAARVNLLRQCPEINQKSREYYGVLGRAMREMHTRTAHDRSHNRQQRLGRV